MAGILRVFTKCGWRYDDKDGALGFPGNHSCRPSCWLKRETKWLITSLDSARDWDVFLSELLAPVEAARPETLG